MPTVPPSDNQDNPPGDGVDEEAISYANPLLPLETGVWDGFFVGGAERRFRAGTVFTYMGPEHGVYYIKEGRIGFYILSPKGTEQTFCILGPGATFGEMNLVDSTPTRWLAEARTNVVLGFIDITTARDLVSENPELAWTVITALTQRLKMIGKQMEDRCFRTVPGRIACFILAQTDPRREGPTVALTHEAIASFIGSNRVSVTRALRSMRAKGLIDYARSVDTVRVLDRGGLELLAAEQL